MIRYIALPIRILRTGCEVLLLDNIAWVALLVFLIYEVCKLQICTNITFQTLLKSVTSNIISFDLQIQQTW